MTDTTQPKDNLITREDLKRLAQVHDLNCISVYLPTHRAGEEVNRKQDQVKLKNILRDVRRELEDSGLSPKDRDRVLSGAVKLLEDEQFWRHQSDGLAIFIRGTDTEYYTLPVSFREECHVSDHFYLVPLVPFFNDNGTFYLLALGQQHVKLYEGSRDSIAELVLGKDAPGRLEDVVGTDYEDKSLQYRSGQDPAPGAMYHGQGSGKDDKDAEVEKFIRAVDEEVVKILGKGEEPLVLACDEQYFPVFREVTSYPNLTGTPVAGTPDEADPLLLHEEAWELVRDHFTGTRKGKKARIMDLSATGRTAYGVEDVIPASVDGRVDTLFIQRGEDLYGIYDREKRRVIREDDERAQQASLFNMAVVNTLMNGGEVFVEEPGDMPFKDTGIHALLRY